jgi:hypothetical protein
MAAAAAPLGALTLAVTKAASLAATNVLVGFVCGESNRSRQYFPFTWGFVPQTGDAAGKWLPTVVSVTAITAPDGSGQIGQYKVVISPGTADTVNVASVMTVFVDADTLFITATSTW